MVLSALSVIYISTPESQAAQREDLSNSYMVLGSTEEDDNNKLARSLINALVIVVAICLMTFLIVLLYKYRCMKAILGYMMLASTAILGLLAGTMVDVALERYSLQPDKISFYLSLYNFAIVGTLSIFVPKTAPMYMTQLYLILTSVIVSWQLTNFDDWTAWTLLVFLALYDMFAVLTPCGPLKALIRLMQQDNAPAMPGLLYEASISLRSNNRRSEQRTDTSENRTHDEEAPSSMTTTDAAENSSQASVTGDELPTAVETGLSEAHTTLMDNDKTEGGHQVHERASRTPEEPRQSAPDSEEMDGNAARATLVPIPRSQSEQVTQSVDTFVTCRIPMAIAKLYKLRLANNVSPSSTETRVPVAEGTFDDENCESTRVQVPTFSPDELHAEVDALLPANGGRIELSDEQDVPGETLYKVFNREGELRRILFVNSDGKVCHVIKERRRGRSRDSIKLGLGDFIFYSILVSKAALYSFPTFVACAWVIVLGLGLTLLILAVLHKALPALPISIFLGVTTFLIMRFIVQDFFEDVFLQGAYV